MIDFARDMPVVDMADPPANVEVERGLLGSILRDPARYDDVAAILEAGDFWRESHAEMYRAMGDLRLRGEPLDDLTLPEELARRGLYRDGTAALFAVAEAIEAAPHAAHAEHYAAIVRAKSDLRRLAAACGETLEDVRRADADAGAIAAAAEARVFAVAERAQAARGSAPLAVAVAEAAARIAARGRGEMEGVATGFADLDARLGGCLGDGEVAVVAARPGMGKTALGLGILERVSGRLGVPALLVSLEMGRKEIAERLLSGHARLGGDLLKKPWLMDAAGRGRLADSTAELARWPLHVDDAPTLSMAQIASSARRHRARHGVGLVVIDYLQLIDGSGEGDGRASRQEVVARISRRLKTLAKELRIPVVALSQLNRQSETREDRRPRLADLRESGAIEQDADVVVLLHRPEYYDPNDQPGGAEAIVAKNRNGATGTVRLAFLKGLARFEDHAAADDIPGDL